MDPVRKALWADQNPLALQTLVDPTIKVVDDNFDQRWALPAGWVEIVNRLHRELLGLLDDYEVVRVTNKMGALRYAIDEQRNDAGPDVYHQVAALLEEAKVDSLNTCDLCGGEAAGTLSSGVTRCTEHPADRASSFPGARARPPGYRPAAGAGDTTDLAAALVRAVHRPVAHVRCEHVTEDGRVGGWHHHAGPHACDDRLNHDGVCPWVTVYSHR